MNRTGWWVLANVALIAAMIGGAVALAVKSIIYAIEQGHP